LTICYIDSGWFDDAIRGVGRSGPLLLPRLATWRAAILAPSELVRGLAAVRVFFFEELNVGKKLYVGNLSYETTNANLEELFSPFGSVRSAQVIQDRDTGRSKGFGFVEMSDDNAARAAIQALNDKEHDGRRLAVNEAKPREERSGGGGGGGGGRGGYGRR
jgi:hypothetical protein